MARERVVEVAPTTTGYPEGLSVAFGDLPVLHTIGALELLDRNAIGVCGSRDASDEALRYAYRFGKICAENNFVVVSGHARGVDREAQRGALEAGGATIAVLPEGVDGLHIVRELKPLVNPVDNFLAISMFEPGAHWTAWRAMERNKLIVGLSLALLVVEARQRGGTINAAYECARQQKPLAAVKFGTEGENRLGNRELLLQEKALPLESRDTLESVLKLASEGSRTLGSQIPLAV